MAYLLHSLNTPFDFSCYELSLSALFTNIHILLLPPSPHKFTVKTIFSCCFSIWHMCYNFLHFLSYNSVDMPFTRYLSVVFYFFIFQVVVFHSILNYLVAFAFFSFPYFSLLPLTHFDLIHFNVFISSF